MHTLIRLVSAKGWSGRIPQEEAVELQALKPCQTRALLHVWRQSSYLHQAAYASLLERVEDLGFSAQNLHQTLSYIREHAPIIVHVNLEKHAVQLATDTHYRNLFETQIGDGGFHARARKDWEAKLFGDAYCGAVPFDRCKYGVLNVTNDPQGVRCCVPLYGSSYLLLRGVRLRTTFAAEDSAELQASELATVDNYAHVLEKYTDMELRATLEVGTQQRLGVDSMAIMIYKEAQIHGEIRLKDHVAMVMAHPSIRSSNHGMLEQLAHHCNAPLVWMEDTEQSNGFCEDEDLQRGLELSREDEELRRALEASRTLPQEVVVHAYPASKCFDGEDGDLVQALDESRRIAQGENYCQATMAEAQTERVNIRRIVHQGDHFMHRGEHFTRL